MPSPLSCGGMIAATNDQQKAWKLHMQRGTIALDAPHILEAQWRLHRPNEKSEGLSFKLKICSSEMLIRATHSKVFYILDMFERCELSWR